MLPQNKRKQSPIKYILRPSFCYRFTILQLTTLVFIIICSYYMIYHLFSKNNLPPIIQNMQFDSILDNNDDVDIDGRLIQPPVGKSCVIDVITGNCKPFNSNGVQMPKHALFAYNKEFYLDGQPFRILSGSFHYFRTIPQQWGDRLLKMRAAGLNTVDTYIPWNLHEPFKDEFNFSGLWNLVDFIKMVNKLKMKLIVRPGPYICSEYEFGGLPSWLLREPMKIRSADQLYQKRVEIYFSHLLPLLSQHQYSSGKGPIIAFQIENEYGAMKSIQKTEKLHHLRFLLSLFKSNGITELLFTSDSSWDLSKGNIPDIITAINFKDNAQSNLDKLSKFQPNKPLFIAEWWTGWFDHWGEKHHIINDLKQFENEMSIILERNASVNLYMMVGGSNFGFSNGANNSSDDGYQPVVTSYDYDSPIGEDGSLRKSFYVLRRLLKKYHKNDLPDINDLTIIDNKFGKMKLKLVPIFNLYQLVNRIGQQLTTYQTISNHIIPMEMLNLRLCCGQSYGYLHLKADLTPTDDNQLQLKFDGLIRDRMQLFINRQLVKTFNDTDKLSTINVKKSKKYILEMLVENLGRVNYGDMFNKQQKGFIGTVFFNDKPINRWQHTSIDFSPEILLNLNTPGFLPPNNNTNPPILYEAIFNLKSDKTSDIFIDTSNFGKGFIIVNDFLLGRYWNIGPQKTLYLPADLLKKKNRFLVFELEKNLNFLQITDRALLG